MNEKDVLSAAGRIMASKRARIVTSCVVCGKKIEGTTRRKYCSAAHAQQAFRDAHRDAVNDRRRELRHQKKGE